MQTVEGIIKSVYGSESEAATRLGVGRSAVSNWKAWKYFPTRVLASLCAHAREKGIELDVTQIPTKPDDRLTDQRDGAAA